MFCRFKLANSLILSLCILLSGCSLFLSPRNPQDEFARLAAQLEVSAEDPRAQGRLAESEPQLMRARQTGDRWAEAIALHNLGTAYKRMGKQDEALRLLEQARQRFVEAGQPGMLAENLRVIASCQALRGDTERALATYDQTLKTARSAQLEPGALAWLEAGVSEGIAAVYAKRQDWPQAIRYAAEARAQFQQAGDSGREVRVMVRAGLMYAAQGDIAGAVAQYTAAHQRSVEVGNAQLGILSLTSIAMTHLAFGQHEPALAYTQQALAVAQQAGDARAAQRLTEYAAMIRAQQE